MDENTELFPIGSLVRYKPNPEWLGIIIGYDQKRKAYKMHWLGANAGADGGFYDLSVQHAKQITIEND